MSASTGTGGNRDDIAVEFCLAIPLFRRHDWTMTFSRFVFVLGWIVAIVPVAASMPIYNDIETNSPNGRYSLTARSPDNATDEEGNALRFGFGQSDFLYRMIDTKTGKTLWTRMQAMRLAFDDNGEKSLRPDEPAPIRLFVSDDGWAVIQTVNETLIVVDIHGKERGTVDLSTEISRDINDRQAVAEQPRGYWTSNSIWYFGTVAGRNVFAIRTWWDRVLTVDLEQGRIRDFSNASQELATTEKQLILDVLRLPTHPAENQYWIGQPGFRLNSAIYWAGIRRYNDAIPEIQRWQNAARFESGSSVSIEIEPAENGIDFTSIHISDVLQDAKTALRRLGVTPTRRSATKCSILRNGEPTDEEPRTWELDQQLRGVEVLELGMEKAEVYELIGFPDFAGSDNWPSFDLWSYDIDAQTPFSLDIGFEQGKVKTIQRVDPPKWQTSDRDHELFSG